MEKLTVGTNDAGQRLDKFLTKTFRNLPKSMMYKFIRTKKIKVNRKRAEIGQMLIENDTVELFLPREHILHRFAVTLQTAKCHTAYAEN